MRKLRVNHIKWFVKARNQILSDFKTWGLVNHPNTPQKAPFKMPIMKHVCAPGDGKGLLQETEMYRYYK